MEDETLFAERAKKRQSLSRVNTRCLARGMLAMWKAA